MGQFFEIMQCTKVFFFLLCVLGFLLFIIVLQSNPVYSVFMFVCFVFLIAFAFVLIGAEFFAIMLFIIYVGVIAVIFLFIIIMYNLEVLKMPQITQSYTSDSIL